MKRNFLITTAAVALLAGTMFAAAQGQVQIQDQGGASPGGVRIQGQGEAQGQTDKSQDKSKAQRSQKKEQPRTQGQGGGNVEGQVQGQGETGQPKQGQRNDGKAPKQPGQTQRGGAETQQGAEQKSGGGGGGSVTLSTEQRTKIRTTVLQGKNAPRVTNVNFSIRVGTLVPRDRVKLVAVSPILVEIHPEWRGYVYFIVDDQIVIVEPRSYKIVAVLVV